MQLLKPTEFFMCFMLFVLPYKALPSPMTLIASSLKRKLRNKSFASEICFIVPLLIFQFVLQPGPIEGILIRKKEIASHSNSNWNECQLANKSNQAPKDKSSDRPLS